MIEQATKEFVRHRAENRCEYCRLKQSEQPAFAFHVEHIRPIKHGGTDDPSNLALACRRCNWCKGPNLSGVDPESEAVVELFNPRLNNWEHDFASRGAIIVGRTPAGRASVRVLQMNDPTRIRLRTLGNIS